MSESGFLKEFSALGLQLREWIEGSRKIAGLESAVELAYKENEFFTPYMQKRAIEAIAKEFLEYGKLSGWLHSYGPRLKGGFPGKRVAVIMAGNIPLVGFHDFLSVMASGADAIIKLSSKDSILLPALFTLLCGINGSWEGRVEFVTSKGDGYGYLERFAEADAIIATGSDMAKETIAKAMQGRPFLSRGSRFSYGVIESENIDSLEGLAEDVFLYFGLGCRSISYLLIKRGTDISKIVEELKRGERLVAENRAYMNNYRRIKAIYEMEGREYIDGGFFIMAPESEKGLPMGLLGYRYYDSQAEAEAFEREKAEKIQKKYRTFGTAQSPLVGEYADNIDTVGFLIESL